MDHGYINPISDRYKKLIATNFKLKKWDKVQNYIFSTRGRIGWQINKNSIVMYARV